MFSDITDFWPDTIIKSNGGNNKMDDSKNFNALTWDIYNATPETVDAILDDIKRSYQNGNISVFEFQTLTRITKYLITRVKGV